MKKILLCLGIFFLTMPMIKAADFETKVPVGFIQSYGGNTLPGNYLEANGQELSRSEYKELFEIIGTTYGAGDGKTTFNLPNLNGKVVVGLDGTQSEFNTLGKTGGEKSHVLTIEEMPRHTHEFVGEEHTHTFTGSEVTTSLSDDHSHSIPKLTGKTEKGGAHTHYTHSNHNYQVMTVKIDANLGSGLSLGGGLWYGGYYGQQAAVATYSTTHTHTVTLTAAATSESGAHTHEFKVSGSNKATKVSGSNKNTGGGNAHNNLQPYIVLKYIIKVK